MGSLLQEVFVKNERSITMNNNVWLETLAECCKCHPDAVGNMPCDNGCICSRCEEPWVNEVYESKLKQYKLRMLLEKDALEVLNFMERNDPNGDYSVDSILEYPMAHIETLEQWKEDMGYESTEAERIKIDNLVSILYVIYLAKNPNLF